MNKPTIQKQVNDYIRLEEGSDVDPVKFPDFGSDEFVDELLDQSAKLAEKEQQ